LARGDTISANRYLIDRFTLGSFDSSVNSGIDFGLFVSSDILANSSEYINRILMEKPEAIGYEMEGAGLIHVCNVIQGKWILVKAICDWGMNKDNSAQKIAAENAFEFIFKTIDKHFI